MGDENRRPAALYRLLGLQAFFITLLKTMLRVLVVDDEPSMREMLVIMLTKEGYDVITADSRATAAKALARGPVDMVITDLGVFTIDRKGGGGMTLIEVAPGTSLDEIKSKTEANYRAALKIDPDFDYSQLGLGDTYALMGHQARARVEYDRAIQKAHTEADRLSYALQSATTWAREGNLAEADKAFAAVADKAHSAGFDLARDSAEAQRSAAERARLYPAVRLVSHSGSTQALITFLQ
jgi:CheY-like chemotaxis protein